MSGKGVPKHLRKLAASPAMGGVPAVEPEPESGATRAAEESKGEPEGNGTATAPTSTTPPALPTIVVPDEETLWEALGY